MKQLYLALFLSTAASTTAFASPIIYHGMNPQISPSAFTSGEPVMNDIANLTKPKNSHAASNALTPASEADIIKRALLSGTASYALQKLTTGPVGTGRVDFEGGYAIYTDNGSTRTITFYDANGHATTTVSFPI